MEIEMEIAMKKEKEMKMEKEEMDFLQGFGLTQLWELVTQSPKRASRSQGWQCGGIMAIRRGARMSWTPHGWTEPTPSGCL